MRDQSVGLDRWLVLAAVAASLGLCSTWLHYFWAQGIALQVWPRTANVTIPSGLAGLSLVLMGACCFRAYQLAEAADLPKLLRAALLVHLILLPSLPLTSTDLFSYLAYGEIGANGLDMKQVGPAALPGSAFSALTPWQNTPSVYGPFADALMLFVGWIGKWTGSPVWGAGVVYKLIVGLLDMTSIWLLFRIAKRAPTSINAHGFALFALNPLLVWEVASQGHNDGLIVVAAIAYLAAMAFGTELLGVAFLVLGSLAKFLLAPTLALHLWAVAKTGLRRAVPATLLSIVLVIAFILPRWSPEATLSTWLPQLRPGIFPPYAAATSLCSVGQRIWASVVSPSEHDHAVVHATFTWAGRIIVLAVTLLLLPRLRSINDVPRASLLLLLAIIGTATTLAPWYLTWLLPFAAVEHERRWQILTLGITLASSVSLCAPGLWPILPLSQIAVLLALLSWTWKLPDAGTPVLNTTDSGESPRVLSP